MISAGRVVVRSALLVGQEKQAHQTRLQTPSSRSWGVGNRPFPCMDVQGKTLDSQTLSNGVSQLQESVEMSYGFKHNPAGLARLRQQRMPAPSYPRQEDAKHITV